MKSAPHIYLLQARNAARSARAALKTERVHRGEPTPEIGIRGQASIALFAAWAVEHLVIKDDHGEFVRVLRDAETALRQRLATDELARAMRRWTTATERDPPRRVPTWLAYSAAAQVDDYCKRESGGANAFRTIVEATAVIDHREGREAVLRMLRALDDELRRLDIENALELKRKKPTSKLRHALWRGGPNERQPSFWLAELTDGRFGLLAKEKRRWLWTEGEKDDVFALIPDEWLEPAATAAKEVSGE